MIAHCKESILKGLDALVKELESYPAEKDIWETAPHIANSAGTLALHLAGNLNHFIGAYMGNTGYVRQRDKEFSDRDVPLADIKNLLVQTRAMVAQTLDNMQPEFLTTIFPLENFGAGKQVQEILVSLVGHFNYHLGQVNYHRRILAG